MLHDIRYAVTLAAPDARIHHRCAADAGARHWRDDSDLQPGQRHAAEAGAVSGARSDRRAHRQYAASPVPSSSQSGLTFTLVRDRVRVIEAVAAQSCITNWNLSTSESAISVRGLRVSTDYLKAHGVQPLAGREFTPAEDTPERAGRCDGEREPRDTPLHESRRTRSGKA